MSTPQPPSQYLSYVQQAASGTGLPLSVTEAQANAESGFNPGATSGAGAEGFWQFLPSTYNSYAAQSGVSPGTEYNVADETKVYVTFMNQLLRDEGGSVFKALEAYNAGEGNLSAGSSYASSILSQAGQSQSLQAGTAGATTDSITIPGIGTIPTSVSDVFGSLFNGLLSALGVPSFKDMLQRLGIILLGVALLIVGIRIVSSGSSGGKSQPLNFNYSEEQNEAKGTTRKSREVKTPLGKSRKTTISGGSGEAGLGAGEAVEAAALA